MKAVVRGCLRRYGAAVAGAALFFPALLAASEEAPGSHDALQALLGALEQETKIATRTKMNIDFVPGMVSVLYGEDLLDRGVRDAGEALALIPGIELSISSDGTMLVFVRGIGSVFASGKIKVMLNGVAFNSTLSVATTALTIPTEQIERIELIRGPGSTIYGEFAYSGVVNVITRKKQDQLFARTSDLGQTTLGGLLTRGQPGEDWYTSLSFSGTNIKGDAVESGPDVLRGTPITRAPGETNEKEENRALILHTDYQDFDLSLQWSQVKSGDHFGLNNALPGNGQSLIRDVSMMSLDMGWNFELNNQLTGRARMGWLDYKLESGLHQLFPPGFTQPGFPPGPTTTFANGVLASPNHEERQHHVGVELNYTGIDKHDILLGMDWYHTKQGDVYAVRNYNAQTFAPEPLSKRTGDENWLEEDLQRRLWAIFVQDQFAMTDRLTLTAGVRFDSYDDVGDATSPRIAAVYQLAEKQILKVQYARAFRPPTFLETSTKNNRVVSGNPDIESEFIDTYEMGYIYNDGITIGRATVFYTDLHDLIVVETSPSSVPKYINSGELHVMGMELEYSRKIGRDLKFDGNVTLIEAENEELEKRVPGVASVLMNAGIIYRLNRQFSVAGQYRYVGERERAPGDPRDNLKSYQTVDVTLTAKNLIGNDGLRNLSLRGGVKNLFDDDVVYPASLTNFNSVEIPSYPEDYPRPGREYWLQMDVHF